MQRLVNIPGRVTGKILIAGTLPIAFLSACQESSPDSSERPNIVWIIANDYSPDAGCYGNEIVQTPNIDELAKQGKKYVHAFVTNPVCSPSRSAFYTGMYQTTIRAHQHRTYNKPDLPDSVEAITRYFQEAGYFTSNGKGHKDSPPGKTDFNFQHDEVFDGTDWSQREPGQPFFASVQINYPHRAFESDPGHPINPDSVNLPPYYPDHPVARADWAEYLGDVQLLDKEVGRVLDRLEEEGLAKNTVVFFFSDHGRPHVRGKQWIYDSGIRVPLIIRWPENIEANTTSDELVSLIDIAAASLDLAGIEIPESMQGKNFLSDTVSREYIYAARHRTDAVVDNIRSIRDKRYKYIKNFMPDRPYMQFGHYKAFRYPVFTLLKVLHERNELTPVQEQLMAPDKPAEELYDLKEDPYEINNLAKKEEYSEIKSRMKEELFQWMEKTHDPGSYDPDNYDSLIQRRQEKYNPRWKQRGIDPHETPPEEYLEWWKEELGIDVNSKN